jgi:hydrogenase maturation protein HypF
MLVAEVATRLRARGAGGVVGLTGGVFQNAVLTERTAAALGQAGFEVAIHRLVPPNDGGLALGQAVIARSGVT